MTKIIHLTGADSHDADDDTLNTIVLNDLEAEIKATNEAVAGDPRADLKTFTVFNYESDRDDLEIDYDPNVPRPLREEELIIPSENAIMASAPEEDDEDEEDDGTDFGGTERDDDLDYDDELDDEEDKGPPHYNLYGMCSLDPDALIKMMLDDGETVESEKARCWWVQHGTVFQLDLESTESTDHSTYPFTKDELPTLASAFRAPPNGFTSKPTPVYFNSWGVGTAQRMIVMHTIAPSPYALPKDHYAYRESEEIDDRMAGHMRVTIMDINGVNSVLLPHAVAHAIASQIDKLYALI